MTHEVCPAPARGLSYGAPLGYGLKIKNIEASTLFEYNNGVRDHYEYKEAMFTHSLFYDFLIENGLKTWKGESTRDIICLEFHYGSRSYRQEMDHLRTLAHQAHQEYVHALAADDSVLIDRARGRRKKILSLAEDARKNRSHYHEMSKAEIRKYFYNHGVTVEYVSRKRNGEVKQSEKIHYQMFYRSTGKAKKGSCMFIRDRLYQKALDFLRMGIKLPVENPKLVEIGAYAPLISSTIVGKIQIDPQNILILRDVERQFETDVVSVEVDPQKHCVAKMLHDYKVKNTLFDGQALIDSSIFPEWGNGFLLLRHHFCKMAAFSSNMQDFFRDYFGSKYLTATVKDMFGNEHFVKDIRLITTDNAMKWLKFDVTYEYWCQKVRENNSMFGIVKTAHESKLGSVQRMSYQMVNALEDNIMENVVRESVAYVNRLKQDTAEFVRYLRQNSNFSNDYEVLAALYEHNPEFERSSYFRERKKTIIKNYVLNMKSGRLLQNAENLVIVGSPYAMLLYGATGDEASVDGDDTFATEKGAIQCYTERFCDGEYLAFFRSPFNSKNNLACLHNRFHENLKKYFNLGQQCIAVNMIGTDFQDRNNGSDQDSDSGYTTNQPDIVAYAKYCYANYPTIVNHIPKDSRNYQNTMDAFAEIDNRLAEAQRAIGESSNLAQLCLTYTYNFPDQKYRDYVCILAVLAQVAIDNAKRQFDVDLNGEIKRIKADMDLEGNRYPIYWKVIKHGLEKNNINKDLLCPMNYVYNLNLNRFRHDTPTLPMSDFFLKHKLDINRGTCKRVESFIEDYSLKLYNSVTSENQEEDYLLLRHDFEDLIQTLRALNISNKYLGLMSWLIDRAFLITDGTIANLQKTKSTINKNRSLLLKVLYETNPDAFLKCFVSKESR